MLTKSWNQTVLIPDNNTRIWSEGNHTWKYLFRNSEF